MPLAFVLHKCCLFMSKTAGQLDYISLSFFKGNQLQMKFLCSTAKMKILLRVILELLQLKIKDTNSAEVGMQNWRTYCTERVCM